MRIEDALSAMATGVWRWDHAAQRADVDPEAVRLFALPTGTTSVSKADLRCRFHPADWPQVNQVINRALTQRGPSECQLRIVDAEDRSLRVVRMRAYPLDEEDRDDGLTVIGIVQELPEAQQTGPGGAEGTAPEQATVEWLRSREAFLLDAGRALAEARTTEDVLRVTARLSMPDFSPDGLVIFRAEAGRLVAVGHRGYDTTRLPFAELPLEADHPGIEVLQTGHPVYISSPEEYRRRYPGTWALASRFGRESWAFLPLIVQGRTEGVWLAAFGRPVSFTPDERSILTTVARYLGQALSRTSRRESERELTLRLQRSMLPTTQPDIPGMTVASRYVPTGGGLQVGGDWYDVIPLPSGRFALAIGDVQGHDVYAASVMGQLRIALRAYASEGHPPDAVLSRASRFLCGLNGERSDSDPTENPRFATCLYLELDPERATLEVARAGHPDLVTRMSDGTLLVRQTAGGPPLGLIHDADYPISRLQLEPGDLTILYTDGLIETGGHDWDSGWARLRDAIEASAGKNLETMADTLVDSVHGQLSHHTAGRLSNRREDDIALMLLCYNTPGCGCDGEVRAPRRLRRTAQTIAQAEPERVSGVRRQLRDLLHDWAVPEQVDSAELMTSEMVTNVLIHTDDDAQMVAEVAGEAGERRLRVEVGDASDELPHRRRPGELASSGRGLMLLEMLAHSWGVDPRGKGKCTWFELYENAPEPGGSLSDELLAEEPALPDAEPGPSASLIESE
ncbi:ATP-binding SpoIIE family protein phosphatase [Streptomyces sp. TP-A0874]|uniref:ATP-binding SpoIIE family protein phosphatase n=1 Tax=Streptomyces sp. TP-A0874 TaxID=549819 RepID=UPI000853B0E1|nr:SpoIIE family protein phosphatase [Streptomyces sp. TP-A0874]